MKELAERGEKWARKNGRSPYDVMLTKDIAALPVQKLVAKDCVLFLWATYPKLEDAFEVLHGWGFTYKTVAFTWVKFYPRWATIFWERVFNDGLKETLEKILVFGLGFWTRQNPEVVLLATRGHPKRINNCVPNVILAPRGQHSAKPEEARRRIVQLVGDLPRVELFAREKADGWDAIGNEIDGRDIREVLNEG